MVLCLRESRVEHEYVMPVDLFLLLRILCDCSGLLFFSLSFAFYAITEGWFSNSNFCGPKREDFQIIEGSITKQCLDSNIDGPCNLIMTSHNDVDLHTDVPCHEQSSYNIYRKVHGKIQSSQVACFTVCKGTTCSNISLMLEMRSTGII